MQARAASPSTCTVQAPHNAAPHPYFVPVRPSSSRRYQSSGIDGSPSKDCVCPFTCNLTIGSPPCPFKSVRVARSSGAVSRRDFGRPFDEGSSARQPGCRANLGKGVNLIVPPGLFDGQQVCVTQELTVL